MPRIFLLASLLLLADLRVDIERRVPALMRAGEVPGVSIAVIRDSKLFWSGAFGVADPSTGAVARPDTTFQAASLSKPVFAYIVLRLVDRGALGRHAPLSQRALGACCRMTSIGTSNLSLSTVPPLEA